jgi:pimeloyl-ACP methyl ester carboxylesterase
MTTAEKPTLVFIPGAWHGPEAFETVISQLKGHGYPVTALHLPSVGGDLSTTMTDDAAYIQKAVSPLVEDGKEVVLVMHSYGGVPGTESVKGLSKKEREAAGKEGGVASLVYLTSFLLVPGLSLAAFLNNQMPPWITFDVSYPIPSESSPVVAKHTRPLG